MFLRECIFLTPFCFIFSLFSLSLVFLYLQVDLLYASASETNRVGFTEFLLQKQGEGEVCTAGAEEISKLRMR